MESAVIFFFSLCIAFGTTAEIASDTEEIVPESTHVKSIKIPYHAPVHVTGYSPATTLLEAPVLRAHSFSTEVEHHVPVAIGAVHAPVKSSAIVPAVGPIKSVLQHEVPIEVAPAPAIVPVEGPVKSSALKAFSFATEVKHEVPVVAAPFEVQTPVVVAPAISEPIVKSIHAPAIVAPAVVEPVVKSIHTPAIAPQVIVQAPAVAPVEPVPFIADGPVKSSGIKAFSFATQVRHEVPVVSPVVAAPVITEPHVKSIHAPAIASQVVAHAPAAIPAVKSIIAPAIAHAPAVAPIVPVPAIAHADGPVKSSAIKAFSFATEVRHGVPVAAAPIVQAPVVSAPVKSIHTAVSVPEAIRYVSAIAPVAKSIHASAIAPQVVRHIPASAPLAKSIHTPVVAPAIRAPLTHPYITVPRHRRISSAFGAHAPVLSAAGLIGTGYSYPGHLPRRLSLAHPYTRTQYRIPSASGAHAPVLSAAGLIGTGYSYPGHLPRRLQAVNVNANHRFYGSFPRLYASLAAPGAALWRGHPVSSGVAYLGGISRGAFGYHPVPVHYQGHQSPMHGVWNYYHG